MSARTIQHCDKLREMLPDEVRTHLDGMLNGEFTGGDAEILYHHLPDELRGRILLCLPHWNPPLELLRECIRHFWKDGHHVILEAAGFSLERVREMFRQARFPLPRGIPPVVPVWRGTAGRTLQEACEGLCWTLDRDAACWFATDYEGRNAGKPIVVRASIRSDQILFFDQNDGLHEKEVILDRINDGEIDPGTEFEWQERARQFIEKRKQAGE